MRGKQFDPVRNEQTMEVLREEKQLRFCLWMNKQQEGRELEVCEPSAQSWESRIAYVSDGSRFSPAIVKSTRVECACG